jgi:hypothetical protein
MWQTDLPNGRGKLHELDGLGRFSEAGDAVVLTIPTPAAQAGINPATTPVPIFAGAGEELISFSGYPSTPTGFRPQQWDDSSSSKPDV